MPVDDDHDFDTKIRASYTEGGRGRRRKRRRRREREIWVNFSITSSDRRNGDTNHADSSESNE
ncbi:hypothetical protein LguiA_032630 [Lonicera macranthoides]